MRTEIRCKVELREDDTLASPGRLTGTLLTYGERASDRPELFERGSIDLAAITASGGIVINRQHTRGAPIMRVIPELRGDALVIDAQLPEIYRRTRCRCRDSVGFNARPVCRVQGAPGAHGVRRPANQRGHTGSRWPGR